MHRAALLSGTGWLLPTDDAESIGSALRKLRDTVAEVRGDLRSNMKEGMKRVVDLVRCIVDAARL